MAFFPTANAPWKLVASLYSYLLGAQLGAQSANRRQHEPAAGFAAAHNHLTGEFTHPVFNPWGCSRRKNPRAIAGHLYGALEVENFFNHPGIYMTVVDAPLHTGGFRGNSGEQRKRSKRYACGLQRCMGVLPIWPPMGLIPSLRLGCVTGRF